MGSSRRGYGLPAAVREFARNRTPVIHCVRPRCAIAPCTPGKYNWLNDGVPIPEGDITSRDWDVRGIDPRR